MEVFDKIKYAIGIVIASVTGWLGVLAIPIYVMVGSSILDYFTGLYAAKYRGQKISSYQGVKGIMKKVMIWLLVVVGVLLDVLIAYAAENVGINIGASMYVSCAVAIWVICNEIISILENVKDAGVNAPSWLDKILQNIKSQIDTTIDKESEDK